MKKANVSGLPLKITVSVKQKKRKGTAKITESMNFAVK